MNSKEKNAIEKTADCAAHRKRNRDENLNKYFKIGLACLALVILNRQFKVLSYIFSKNVDAFVSGTLCSLGLLLEWIGLCQHHNMSLKQKKLTWIKGLKR